MRLWERVLVVECSPDAVLAQVLTGVPRKCLLHEANKPEVVKRLVKYCWNSKGLVDEDPGAAWPRLIREFRNREHLREYGLSVFHDPERGNQLVVLHPRLEEWILAAAQGASVPVERYDLPSNSAEFRKIVKLSIDRFEHLVRDLYESRSKRLLLLAELLR